MAITFLTTTSYGTWLPGDLRGYVRKGVILPGDPQLLKQSRSIMKGDPVLFSLVDRDRLLESLVSAAAEFGYRLSDVAIESWHLHWIAWHSEDPASKMAGRLKNRMRQSLGRGRIWTEGYCGEPLLDDRALQQTQEYIARHSGCRMSAGNLVG
jgi:hypothetical protein